MGLVFEALRVNLVNILGAGRAGCKPTAVGDHFQAANRRVIARGARQFGDESAPRPASRAVTASGDQLPVVWLSVRASAGASTRV